MVRKAARGLSLIGLTVTRSVTVIRGISKSKFETGSPARELQWIILILRVVPS